MSPGTDGIGTVQFSDIPEGGLTRVVFDPIAFALCEPETEHGVDGRGSGVRLVTDPHGYLCGAVADGTGFFGATVVRLASTAPGGHVVHRWDGALHETDARSGRPLDVADGFGPVLEGDGRIVGFWHDIDRYPLRPEVQLAIDTGADTGYADQLRWRHTDALLRDLAARCGTSEIRAQLDPRVPIADRSPKELLALAEAFGAAAWEQPEGTGPFAALQEASMLIELAALQAAGDL